MSRACPIVCGDGNPFPSFHVRRYPIMKKSTLLTVLSLLGGSLVASAADPRANWEEHCAKCHGSVGKGDTKMGKKLRIRNLTTAKVQAEFTDEQAFEAMKQGLMNAQGKITMKATEGLSDEEMKALVGFVRGLKR
jgi:cytochrome c553